ncbi:hypothetical protein GW17_00044129 [Ensete ventricosum]|nr:hypothetical protein GW17_00044129 [Ensete ventricosum]RZS14835.1 hypothetical protein BHM03_00046582 [Ensete ventricosum]
MHTLRFPNSGIRAKVVGRPHGAAAHGQPCRQQGRRRWPQGWSPLGRVAADRKGQPLPEQGQQQHRGGKGILLRKMMILPL